MGRQVLESKSKDLRGSKYPSKTFESSVHTVTPDLWSTQNLEIAVPASALLRRHKSTSRVLGWEYGNPRFKDAEINMRWLLVG